jgi:hypothetical protein
MLIDDIKKIRKQVERLQKRCTTKSYMLKHGTEHSYQLELIEIQITILQLKLEKRVEKKIDYSQFDEFFVVQEKAPVVKPIEEAT